MYGVTYNKKMLFEREFPIGTIVREVSLRNPDMEPSYMYICSKVRKYESESSMNGMPEIDIIPLFHYFFYDILFGKNEIGQGNVICDVCDFERITPSEFRRFAITDVREEIRREKQIIKKKCYERKVMLKENHYLLSWKYSDEERKRLSIKKQNIIHDFERVVDDIKFYRRMLQENKKVHRVLMKDYGQFLSCCEQITLNTHLCRMNQKYKKT